METAVLAAPLTLTSCQEKALDILKRQGNVFLTGAAGTGKTFLLDYYLQDKPADLFPVVASTGAAAVLIGGRTFHSFFGLGIMEGGPEATVARATRSGRVMRRLQIACVVVIDEVSMLSGEMLATAEKISRIARRSDEPWGGLRIIAVGDFAQLPPITHGGYDKDWAFLHQVWHHSEFRPALLSTVMRTQDADFLDILNFVRAGIVNDDVRAFLDDRTSQLSDNVDATRLYPHRAQAEEYNQRRLQSIPGSMRSFATQYGGDERYMESAKKSLPIPETLHLKEGALVMLRKNDVSPERLYVNGSLGHIRSMTEDTLYISLLTGDSIELEKQKFTCLDGDGKEILGAWNFPVTLAWASTIHKAQGASLDRMIVDLSSLWEPGQAYVALSRVRSTAGLFVERWSPASIRAEQLVTQLYDGLADEMRTYTPRPLFTPPARVKREKKEGPTEGVKLRRAGMIRSMLNLRKPFDEIVTTCNVKADRVLLYIEDFLEQGISLDLDYLTADIPEVQAIRDAFEECGTDRLRPTFDALEERIPYTTLRLVRCAIMAESGA